MVVYVVLVCGVVLFVVDDEGDGDGNGILFVCDGVVE